eukprot:TRINITY_DN36246_c0_g2_i1.p1 TRINITY_DN36246_c0_g2~~TRINITY_DN36246_c0_g2_i1.p1  ORF type:complete len:537 (-),score=74.10 TRINITY_DN36246_c0_g2_i1:47-1525(-)
MDVLSCDNLVHAAHRNVSDATGMERALTESIEDATEGLMVKQLNAVYQAGERSHSWMKLKKDYLNGPLSDSVDAVVVAVKQGTGKRRHVFGSFLLAVTHGDYELLTLCSVGTGLSFEDLKLFRDTYSPHLTQKRPYDVVWSSSTDWMWLPPFPFQRPVWEVACADITFSEFHSSGFALRFPRVIRTRTEKDFRQATTLLELKNMFRKQPERDFDFRLHRQLGMLVNSKDEAQTGAYENKKEPIESDSSKRTQVLELKREIEEERTKLRMGTKEEREERLSSLETPRASVNLSVVAVKQLAGKRRKIFGSFLLAGRDRTPGKLITLCSVSAGLSLEDLLLFYSEHSPHVTDLQPDDVVWDNSDTEWKWLPPSQRPIWEITGTIVTNSTDHASGFALSFPQVTKMRIFADTITSLQTLEESYGGRSLKQQLEEHLAHWQNYADSTRRKESVDINLWIQTERDKFASGSREEQEYQLKLLELIPRNMFGSTMLDT